MVSRGRRLKSGWEATRVEIGEAVQRSDRPWWLRARAAFFLGLLLTGLGIVAAAVVGVLALGVAALFDQALG